MEASATEHGGGDAQALQVICTLPLKLKPALVIKRDAQAQPSPGQWVKLA